MTSNPAFEFEDLREQELRDIVLNVSRLVKKGKIVPEAFSYCAGYIKVILFAYIEEGPCRGIIWRK